MMNVGVIKQAPDQVGTYRATVVITSDQILPNPVTQFTAPATLNQIYGTLGVDQSYMLAQVILTGVATTQGVWQYTFAIKLAKLGTKLDVAQGPPGEKGDRGDPGPKGPKGDPGPGGTFTPGGDLSGSSTSQTVIGIQGNPVSAAAPSSGAALVWNAGTGEWEPGAASGFTAGGDLSGTSSSQTVVGFQGRTVAATAPSNGQVYAYNTCTSEWDPVDVNAIKLQGNNIASSSPADRQVLTWSGGSSQWGPADPTGGGGGKDAVWVVATTDQSPLSGLSKNIDSVNVDTDGLRVLLTGQGTGTDANNGIWVAHSGAWTRPTDFAAGSHAAATYVFAQKGTLLAHSGWICGNDSPADVVGTDALSYSQFTGGGGSPSGPASGDLSGTYPSPSIANLAVTDAKVAVANKDGLASVASMRTLGTGATQSCAGNDSRLSDARTPTAHATSHKNGGSDEVATATAAANAIPKAGAVGTLGIGWLPTGSTSSTVCIGNDARLSDARTPTAHSTSHKNGGSDEVATATAAANSIPKTAATTTLDIGWIPTGSTSTTVCIGNDSRLSDSRTPTAHSTSHKNGGSDEVATATAAANAIPKAGSGGTLDVGWLPTGSTSTTVCIGNDSRLSDARAPTSHAASHQHGGLDEVATATAAANTIPKSGATGTLGIGWLPTGSTSSTVCIGNDSRLSDARAPTAHASSHKNGGSDEVATATAAANSIPKTAATTTLDIGWIPTGTTGTTVCIGNDSRLSDSRAPSGTASGDLSGTYPSPTVAKIQNNAISSSAPSNGQFLGWNGTSSQWEPKTGGGGVSAAPGSIYIPLLGGLQYAAQTVYAALGGTPTFNPASLGSGIVVFTFQAVINIPASSTAQVRLYDATNHATVWESSVIAGPQTSYEISQVVTLASGAKRLEFWMSTPTNAGGSASCIHATVVASFS